MRETILLCNKLNQTEFLRTLAKMDSNYHFLRVMNDKELIDYILSSKGVRVKGYYINETDQAFIYYRELKTKTYKDCRDLVKTINSYRECDNVEVLDSMGLNLSKEFKLKRDEILTAYYLYLDYKRDNYYYDKYDLIEAIPNGKLDTDLIYISEFPLTKVMREVINNNFIHVSAKSITEFLNQKSEIKMVQGCYGIENEIDYALSMIKKNSLPLDDTQIVLADTKYLIYLSEAINRLNIKATYRMGAPLITSNPGTLLSYIIELKNGYFGVDGYRKLFQSDSFDSTPFKEFFMVDDPYNLGAKKLDERSYKDFIKYAGWLRLDFNGTNLVYKELYDDNIGNALVFLDKELRKGMYSFIKNYSKSINKIDKQALKILENLFMAFDKYEVLDDRIYEVLSDILGTGISSSLFDSGKLSITTIDQAFSSIKSNTFILGISNDYPGTPKENYLIFDEEYEKIDSTKTFVSTEIIKQKEELFKALLSVSGNTYITYPTYTLGDLKDSNPSSLITEYIKKDMKIYGYSDSSIHKEMDMIKELSLNQRIDSIKPRVDVEPYNVEALLNKEYPPSKIFEFLNDNPLKFILESFYRVYMDDPDDPFQVIPANTKGDIIHFLMEGFQKDKVSINDFKEKALVEWDKMMKKRPPMVDMRQAKLDFMDGIEKVYNQDSGNTFDSAEIEYHYTFPNGIKVGGRYDRLEKDSLGRFILVDYKTGKSMHQKDEDPNTCIQGLLYAEIIEKCRGIQISRIEYRYPYAGIVHITNSLENKQFVYQKIEEFKQKILQGELYCENKAYDYEDKYLKLLSLMKAVKRG